MLESIRTHQKALQLLLLLIIFPSFAFFGIQSYTSFFDKSTDLVKVNGQTITQAELDVAVKRQADRTGGDPALLNNPRFKQGVLNELVQQKLVAYELGSLNLQVSDQALANRLLMIPDIAALKKADGSIDQDKYRQLLAANQMTISQFENARREEIKANELQFALALGQGGISSSKVADKLLAGLNVEREVQAIFFLAKDYISQVKPSNEALQSYYKANSKQFETTPSANVEFVVLKSDSGKSADKDYAAKADKFANLVFEQSESLKPVADQLKLKIETVYGLSSNGLGSLSKDHPLNQVNTLKAVFTEDILKNGRNTEAIQVAPGVLIAVRVVKYNPPAVRSYEEVKAEVLKAVSLREADALAAKAGSDALSILDKDPTSKEFNKKFSKAVWVSRAKPLDLRGEAYEKVFGVKLDKLPAVTSASTPGVGLAIFRVNESREPKSSDIGAQIAQFKQIGILASQAEIAAYFSNIRDKANLKLINAPK